MTLNPRQQQFCLEYVADFNATKAYERAYGEIKNPSTAASILMKNPEVEKKINQLTKDIANDKKRQISITFDWKIEKLQEIIEYCMMKDYDKYGVERMKDARTALSCIVEANVMQGHRAPTRIDVNMDIDSRIQQMHELVSQFRIGY